MEFNLRNEIERINKLSGEALVEFLKNPNTLLTLIDQGITQLYLAGTALDDTVVRTAREARQLGFSVFILKDLTQARDERLREGKPRESLMRYYYHLADNENIFSLRSTDLSEEYFAEDGLYMPFSDWLDDRECIKKETVAKYHSIIGNKSSYIIWYAMILFL
jgi:hypothetical protein